MHERAGTASPYGGGSCALHHADITRTQQPTSREHHMAAAAAYTTWTSHASRGHRALLHLGITRQQRTAAPYKTYH
ncbi:hypothetical protein STEG23_024473 [Scotinomys teguina]